MSILNRGGGGALLHIFGDSVTGREAKNLPELLEKIKEMNLIFVKLFS